MTYEALRCLNRFLDPTYPPGHQSRFDVSAFVRELSSNYCQNRPFFENFDPKNFLSTNFRNENLTYESYKKSSPHSILTKFRYFFADRKNINFSKSYGLAKIWPQNFQKNFFRLFWDIFWRVCLWILRAPNMSLSSNLGLDDWLWTFLSGIYRPLYSPFGPPNGITESGGERKKIRTKSALAPQPNEIRCPNVSQSFSRPHLPLWRPN